MTIPQIPQNTPPPEDPVFDDEDIAEMTEELAVTILDKLTKLMDNEEMSIIDLKDVTSMFKDVGAFVHKSSGATQSSSKGLETFISRLKA